jgi:hypothetical protein
MADNLTVTSGNTGSWTAATEDIGGAHHQRIVPYLRSNATTTGFNATTSSSAALAANTARRGLMIQNMSDTDVFGAFNATPVATAGSEVGFLIAARGYVEFFTMVDTRAVNVIHADAGNKRLLITEW